MPAKSGLTSHRPRHYKGNEDAEHKTFFHNFPEEVGKGFEELRRKKWEVINQKLQKVSRSPTPWWHVLPLWHVLQVVWFKFLVRVLCAFWFQTGLVASRKSNHRLCRAMKRVNMSEWKITCETDFSFDVSEKLLDLETDGEEENTFERRFTLRIFQA